MSDAELLQLLQEKLPAEFTAVELAALRARWTESPEIRAALIATLELETELASGLAEVSLSVDDLLSRAKARQHARPPGQFPWWIAVGLIVLLAVGWGGWQFSAKSIPDSQDVSSVQAVPPVSPESNESPNPARTSDASTSTETPKSAEAALAVAAGENSPAATATENPTATGVDVPWTPWLDGTLQPLAADHSRLRSDLRTMGHDELPLAEFQRWWAEVPGIAAGWGEAIIGGRRTVHIDGRMQLKAPWPSDTVLRFTPFDITDMTLLLGDGERGIALRFYRHREPHLWAAYEYQRLPGETALKWGGLLTTDGGGWFRSGAATFEVRHQDRMLILSTGTIPVLTVPMSSAPRVVQLFGRGRLRGFSWGRAEPWPIEPREPRTVLVHQEQQPPWTSTKAEIAMVHTEPDGAVLLTGSSKTDDAQAFTVLPKATLVESIFKLSAADPGTGVYVGNADGKPLALLGICQEQRTNQPAFCVLRPNERRVDANYDPNAFPPPYWSPAVWLRIVSGLGICRIWSSGDGVHWGHVAENPLPDINGPVRSIGLYCFPGETPRTVRLQAYQVRELTGVTSFGDAPEIPDSISMRTPPALTDWEIAAVEQLPDSVPPATWMAHAAVATLKAGPPRSLAREIVERLAQSKRFRDASDRQRRDFLDDALVLLDTGAEQDVAAYRRAYFSQAADAPAALTAAWTAWLQSPVWTHSASSSPLRETQANWLMHGAFADDRAALMQLAPSAQFWLAPAHPDHRPRPDGEIVDRLVRWSRSVVGSGDRANDSGDVLPLSWRHPWQLSVNKEAYNVQSELRSALVGNHFQDAGRIAMNFGNHDSVGLLPDMEDDRLFVSIPVTMASAVRDYPAFADSLRTELEPTGLVRVAQAERQGHLPTLQSATIQFFGTAAAAEAERILGDRSMALGDFFTAQGRYRAAIPNANEAQREVLRGRLLFTESLLGMTTNIDAAELASMKLDGVPLTSLLQENRPQAAPTATPATAPWAPVARYRPEIKARFDGQMGQNAGRQEFRQVDAFGRQFAVVVDRDRFYVSNRFQVTAYQRETAQQIWAASVGSDQGEAHAHRFTPMAPLVWQDKLLVRRITKAGVELACLKREDGQELWKTRGGDKVDVLSEPIALPGRIGVILSHRVEEDSLELRWTLLSPDNGSLLSQSPLLRVRDVWNGELPCVASRHDDLIVAAIAGGVVACDITGSVHWVRRETTLPSKVDPQWDDFELAPPVFRSSPEGQKQVLAVLPGTRSLLALDLASGREQWRLIRPTLQGMIAATEQVLVVAGQPGLVGVNPETGDELWARSLPGRLTAARLDGSTLTIATRQESNGNKFWPHLVRYDIPTGEPRGEIRLDMEDHPDWHIGPFFTVGETWWTLIGRPGQKPQRDLALLLPSSDQPPQDVPALIWDEWLTSPPGERRDVQSILPGWQPLTPARNLFATPSEPVRDQRPVLVTKLTKNHDQVRMLRTVKVPEKGTPSLQLRVGHQPGQRWQLEVRVGGRIVLNEPVSDESAPTGWLDPRISLFPFAGQTVTVQILQKNLDGKPIEALWRDARLVGFQEP